MGADQRVRVREVEDGDLEELLGQLEPLRLANRLDVLGTGTCGNGCLAELRARDAAKYPWLAVGDEIVYEVERLGRIANRIVAGPPLIPLRP